MTKVNVLDALGISQPQGPTKAPDGMALQVMQLACKYLLYERREETAITTAFAQLCEERHKHFHIKQPANWLNCSNAVCTEARQIIASVKKQEVFINPLAAKLMNDYIVNFMPMPTQLRLWLVPRSEAQLPATANEKEQAGRIVLTD